MDTFPFVSVLMPVYNGEQYLRPAIESILSQSFKDFEFIIINDGSTDTTEEIILSYSDSRIRYVRNSENLKLIATLNKGLDLCTGKYIVRMDADDISFPNRIEEQVKFMEANPSIGLCGSQIDVDSPLKSWVQTGTQDLIQFNFLFHNPFCHPSTILRTSVIREHKLYYPHEYIHAEEYMLWIYMIRLAGCYNLSDKLIYYRVHGAQISNVFKKKQLEVVDKIRLEILDEITPFSTAGMRRAHLVIVEATGRNMLQVPIEEMELHLGGWVTLFQLRTWLTIMRLSLLFRKKWDSIYMRTLIAKVAEEARRKRKAEGTYITRMFARN